MPTAKAQRLDLAVAYVAASAETTGINEVASFDTSIDRVSRIERIDLRTPAD